jgi:5-methyltetrahydrofolate--homocysteine methyltransferase
MSTTLVEAIADMREEDALHEVNTHLAGGGDPLAVLEDCRAAMTEVGKRFDAGQYFVPELILAGEMLKQISDLVKPRLTQGLDGKKAGRVVLGTVQGDIHDIGKTSSTSCSTSTALKSWTWAWTWPPRPLSRR